MLLRREPPWIVERTQVQVDLVGRMVVLVGQGTAAVAAEAADHGWRGAIAGALHPAPTYRVLGKGHKSRHRTAAVPAAPFAVAEMAASGAASAANRIAPHRQRPVLAGCALILRKPPVR